MTALSEAQTSIRSNATLSSTDEPQEMHQRNGMKSRQNSKRNATNFDQNWWKFTDGTLQPPKLELGPFFLIVMLAWQ